MKISQIKNDYKNEISQIKNDYKNEMNQIKNDYKDEISQIKNDYKDEMNQIKDELSNVKSQLKQKSNEIKSFGVMKTDIKKLNEKVKNMILIQSKLREDTSTFWLQNYEDIEKFNQLDGEIQIRILAINQNIPISKNQSIFNKIIELIFYLSNEVKKSKKQKNGKFNYISIYYDETEITKKIGSISSIGISWEMTEILFENKTLNSIELQNYISNFSEFYYELRYPSQIFADIYNYILIIKQLNGSRNKISIFMQGVSQTDFNFRNNDNIDCVRFDSTIKIIKGVNKDKDNSDRSSDDCKSLKKILIGPSVTEILNDYFRDCEKLEKITIPSTVTAIGDFSFNSCKSLLQIFFSIPSSGISTEQSLLQ